MRSLYQCIDIYRRNQTCQPMVTCVVPCVVLGSEVTSQSVQGRQDGQEGAVDSVVGRGNSDGGEGQ